MSGIKLARLENIYYKYIEKKSVYIYIFLCTPVPLPTGWLRGLPSTDRKCQPGLRGEPRERPYRHAARRDQQSVSNSSPRAAACGLAASAAGRVESPRCLWRPIAIWFRGPWIDSVPVRAASVYGTTSARITPEEVGPLCPNGGLERMQMHL